MANEQQEQQWGSRLGFILATIGMAFGLGAIWRFPYVAAESGGGAFILIFTFLTIFIAIPAGLAEIAFARKMKAGPIVSYARIFANHSILKRIGWIFPIVPLGLNMYYLVVVSWTMVYTFFALSSGPSLMANPVMFFDDFSANKIAIFGMTAVIVIIVSFICIKGIQGGIEKFCKFCIPLHYIILFLLMATVLTLPGVERGLEIFAKPDMDALLNPSIWARAVGMALFAIGLGPAYLMAYGSHLPEKSDITMDFFTVAMWNLFGCILSGLVVIPAVVAFNLDLQSGPSLTYITLPYIFAQLPFSSLIAFAFFFAMLLGGLSAGVGIMENSVTAFSGGLGWGRKKTVIVIAVITILGSIPCIWSSSFLEKFDFLIGDIGYTLTAFIMAFTLAWYVGSKKVREEWLMPGSSIKLGVSFDVVYKFVVVPLLLFLFYQSLCNIPKFFF
jgi:NSS family neurotransmitter:Na+ symporter